MHNELSCEVHPTGEDDFVFSTAGGKVALRSRLTADWCRGLLSRSTPAFSKHSPPPARSCAPARTSAVYDVLHSFALTALTDGRRFAHVQRLREDPSLVALFGVESIVSDDSIRRLFATIDEAAGQRWVAAAVRPCGGRCPSA
jgi:hypothetical protein